MGADNLAQFHRWRDWREIAERAPILVVDRPGSSFAALSSRAAQALARWRRPESDAARLAYLDAAGLDLPARAAVERLVDGAQAAGGLNAAEGETKAGIVGERQRPAIAQRRQHRGEVGPRAKARARARLGSAS